MMVTLDVARALCVVAFLTCGWLTLGWWLLRSVRATLPAGEAVALALLASAGAQGVALFLIGLVHFSPLVVLAVALAALAPLARAEERDSLSAALRALPRPEVAVLVPLIVLAIALLVIGLARPVGNMGHDGISYHLAGPAYWLRNGRVLPSPDFSHTAFPVVIEMLFGAGMALAGERAPGVIGVLFAFVVVGQTAGLARWLGASARFSAVAGLLVAAMPAMMLHAPRSFVDIEYAAFALAAFRLLFNDATERSWLGPLFLGFCAATKYNGLTLAPITLALAGARLATRHGGADAALFTVRAGVIALAPVLPLLLRNFFVLGTPIYPPPPALARLLPAKGFSYEASVAFQHYIFVERGSGFGRGLADFLLLPWRLTMNTATFHGAGGIGLAPLAFLPAALVARSSSRVRWALAWMTLNTALWFLVQQEARFLAPYIILSAALAVSGAEALVEHYGRWGRAAVGTVLLTSIGYGAITALPPARTALPAIVSDAADARLTQDIPYFNALTFLNALPDPCRVLILSKRVPPYYLEKPYVKITGLYDEHPVPGVETPAAALARLGELGVTHVLDVRVAPPTEESFQVPTPQSGELDLVFDTADARVFAVKRARP